MTARSIDPIDGEVGRLIEMQRRRRGMSQASLAKAVGISFQQLQKYECGKNRVSASRLYHIAIALNCEPGELFPPNPPVDVSSQAAACQSSDETAL